MKKKLLALLMGTSLALAACGGGGDEAGGGDTAGADPEKLFNQKCSSCHGGNLEGGVGPKLSDVGSRLSQDEIESVIANGQGSMPPKLLEGDDASAVAEWLANKK
ncbi:cytochrome c551 [Mesobacillus sp. LC4]|uniref:Cytochrome c n=1 Tax=Mesobacillus selenatarsenatis TaxID=388741 RepID=A0A846TJ16_9BACI|nr:MULTISPECIES: cytochrome c [Mesobacillus]NKE06779.1 cytochrome c [Mesobacillus selenatarsenatis]